MFFIFSLGQSSNIGNLSEAKGISAVLCIVFLLLWRYTRKHVVSITSKGGKELNFEVQGMSEEQITHFVDKLCQAKSNRYRIK